MFFFMKTVLLLTIVQLAAVFCNAYVLPVDTILNKTTALAGNSIISVDQDVIFKEGSQQVIIKENWLIEGDKNLKLTATAQGDLRDFFRISYLYNSKNRTQMAGKSKSVTAVNHDFFEKYLSVKSKDSFLGYLKDLGIAPQARLSRAGGSVCYALGNPSSEQALSPQLWIEQDFFRVRKIRFSSEAEAEFSDYEEYGNLDYPKTKVISWAEKSVTIQVTKVQIKTKYTIKDFYPETIDIPSEIALSNKGPVGATIEEFYMRFR